MTDDEIIDRMSDALRARHLDAALWRDLLAFARAIEAATLERAARVCERQHIGGPPTESVVGHNIAVRDCAAAIRREAGGR